MRTLLILFLFWANNAFAWSVIDNPTDTSSLLSAGQENVRYDEVRDPGTYAGATFGTFTQTWTTTVGNATFFTIAGSQSTTFQGDGDVFVGGDLTITGDDLFMATNTNRFVLMGDGTNYNPEAIDLGTDTTGNYAGSSSEGGAATTATALAANGANCSAGSYPLGVDELGAVESCTVAGTGSSGDPTYNQVLGAVANAGIGFGTYTNTWTFTSGTNSWTATGAAGPFFTVSGSKQTVIRADGNVGIGVTAPTAFLQVGNGSVRFQNLSSCDTIDTDVNGVLSCGTDANTGVSSITSLRYDQISDAGTQAGAAFSTYTQTWTSTATTGDFFNINANSSTTGDILQINMQSGALGAGDAIEIDRSGTKVFGVNSYGQVQLAGWQSTMTTHSGISFGTFNNSWTFNGSGTNLWTSTGTSGQLFNIGSSGTGSIFDVNRNGQVQVGDSSQQSVLGFNPTSCVSANPCVDGTNTYSEGRMWYSCGHFFCYCNNSTAKKMDGSTACSY